MAATTGLEVLKCHELWLDKGDGTWHIVQADPAGLASPIVGIQLFVSLLGVDSTYAKIADMNTGLAAKQVP